MPQGAAGHALPSDLATCVVSMGVIWTVGVTQISLDVSPVFLLRLIYIVSQEMSGDVL